MRSWLALGSLLLVAGSWRLWIPQNAFPRVPLLSVALEWSSGTDEIITWICTSLWVLVTALLILPTLPQSYARIAAILYAHLLGVLVVLDQHRLQPWGVHIAVCLLIATTFEGRQLLSWILAFSGSLYIYSALSKFDAQFLHTVGQDFLAGALSILPGSYSGLPEKMRPLLAALFPIGELVCGAGLLWNRTRKAALAMAIGMHATLIAILGPWGLAHSWGVLLWNVVFIGLNLIVWQQLNYTIADGKPFKFRWLVEKTAAVRSRSWQVCVAALVIALMIVPLGERLGFVDHWLGWALYAPHSSRASIELLSGSAQHQPAVVQKFARTDSSGISAWDRVAVERWSLEELGVPIVPQQRFYVGVARALARSTEEFGIKVTLLDTASRWSGARKQQVVTGRSALEQVSQKYWFNTKPRW